MRPRRVTPDFREKIWGSTRLHPWFPDSDRNIGEVWFDAGLTLLVKFIFTTQKLSVQVHPGDDYARTHHGSRGKTEMWYILAAEPGAKIAAGFHQPITASQLRASAESGEIESLLEWVEAKPGDTFFIPAGTVHAIGAGLALCEIQQNSDVTYRLYDYGRPRELHLDRAAAVSNLGPHQALCPADAPVACGHFIARRMTNPAKFEARGPGFLVVIGGAGEIDSNPTKEGEVWALDPGFSSFEITGKVTLLHASAP